MRIKSSQILSYKFNLVLPTELYLRMTILSKLYGYLQKLSMMSRVITHLMGMGLDILVTIQTKGSNRWRVLTKKNFK